MTGRMQMLFVEVLNEARRRHSNAVRIKGEREARLNNLRQHLADLQSALARNRQESDQCKEKLLKRLVFQMKTNPLYADQ